MFQMKDKAPEELNEVEAGNLPDQKKKKKFKDDLITQRRMDEQRENLKKELEEANRAGKNNTWNKKYNRRNQQ